MAGLVVETGEAREIHQIAVLLAYGASGVNPWMVFEQLPRFREAFGGDASPRVENLADNYIESVKKGVLKMLSKLGISTISSYRGARLYETVGLSDTLAARFFRGTESRFGGIGLAEIESDILEHHARVMAAPSEGGLNGQVVQDGHEERTPHRELPWPPRLAALLTRAVRENDAEAWRVYVDGMDDPRRQPFTLRDLFSFKPTRAIPLDKVQPAAQIVARCSVAAMSCGAISPEAHEALAAGANSAGAWSNSGEGGEDEGRDSYRAAGFDSSSASRQVASGRFGVTVEYAAGARELQIKIAQGAKPGEGGQLP